ncbi:MAG TPA: hypothetical protein VJB87_00740 [Candidatus Nanoarchaeia archaeon]|nr:hypothetical protein [Candidatus Nanoarchaeia archaeon]
MECPNCQQPLKKTITHIENYNEELISYYCKHCSYCDLDAKSCDTILKAITAANDHTHH